MENTPSLCSENRIPVLLSAETVNLTTKIEVGLDKIIVKKYDGTALEIPCPDVRHAVNLTLPYKHPLNVEKYGEDYIVAFVTLVPRKKVKILIMSIEGDIVKIVEFDSSKVKRKEILRKDKKYEEYSYEPEEKIETEEDGEYGHVGEGAGEYDEGEGAGEYEEGEGDGEYDEGADEYNDIADGYVGDYDNGRDNDFDEENPQAFLPLDVRYVISPYKNKDYLILFNILNFSKYIYIFNSKDGKFYSKLNNYCCTSNNIPSNGEYYSIVEEKGGSAYQVSLCSWRKKLYACRFKTIGIFERVFFSPNDRAMVEFDFDKKRFYSFEADFRNPSPVFFEKIHELTEETFFSNYTVDENLNAYRIPGYCK